MGEKGIIEYGVFDAEEHPESGQFQWVWTSPGGAEYRGPQFHDSEADALKALRSLPVLRASPYPPDQARRVPLLVASRRGPLRLHPLRRTGPC
jgi:hypothetical protein